MLVSFNWEYTNVATGRLHLFGGPAYIIYFLGGLFESLFCKSDLEVGVYHSKDIQNVPKGPFSAAGYSDKATLVSAFLQRLPSHFRSASKILFYRAAAWIICGWSYITLTF